MNNQLLGTRYYDIGKVMKCFFRILCLLWTILGFGCANTSIDWQPLENMSVSNDKVSLSSALNIALASYVRGCVVKGQELGAKKGTQYDDCLKKGKGHIKENVLTILNQK